MFTVQAQFGQFLTQRWRFSAGRTGAQPMNVLNGESNHSKTVVRTTQRVPASMRTTYWREAITSILPSLAVDHLTDEPTLARLESRLFGDARLIQIIDKTPACQVMHTPSRLLWRDDYLLVLQLAGHGSYRQVGQQVMLEAGDMMLLDMSQQFDLAFPNRHRELVWALPRETLAPLLAKPERVGIGISGGHGFGALLAASMRMLAGEADKLDTNSQQNLRFHLCNLAALALGATQPAEKARRQTYRMLRRQQIFAYVESHLSENNLVAERVAQDLKMSRRWLYELFSESGTSLTAWIARRRAEECHRLLGDPRYDHLSISAIAYSYGFNDLSTFYRQFRTYCGKKPGEVRQDRTSSRKV